MYTENYWVPNGSEFWGFSITGDLLWIKLVQWEGNSSQRNRDSAVEIIAFFTDIILLTMGPPCFYSTIKSTC